jgi:hypothetical protein
MGDATQVEADTTEITALDDACPQSELSRSDCGDMAARSRSDDHDIECIYHRSCLNLISAIALGHRTHVPLVHVIA